MNPPTPKPPSPSPVPQHVGFECRLCQTRMYALVEHVGKNVKCPDCGAKTPVPPPEVVQAKRQPAALEGEQYELWDADTAPLPSELRAAEPVYIAIECRMCQTLFYATLDQVGQQLACADCGTRHVVPPPAAPRPTKYRPDDDEEIMLDETSPPAERPTVLVPPRRMLLYEEEAEQQRERADRAKRLGKRSGQEVDVRGRPIVPRWPLVTGVVPFLFSPGVPVRWLMLSIVAALAGGTSMVGAASIGLGGGIVAVGMNAIGGFCFFVLGCMVSAFWLAALASIVLAIVVESSEGNSQVYQWPPPNPVEWLGAMVQLLIAGFVCLFPGWLVAQFVPEAAMTVALVMAGSVLLSLPIILLSQLELDSPFAVASGRLLASLVRCPFSWLLFYVEVTAIAAGCIAVAYFTLPLGPWLALLLIPLGVAAMLLSARLLGRLGWKLAESMAGDDTGQDDRAILPGHLDRAI